MTTSSQPRKTIKVQWWLGVQNAEGTIKVEPLPERLNGFQQHGNEHQSNFEADFNSNSSSNDIASYFTRLVRFLRCQRMEDILRQTVNGPASCLPDYTSL